MYIDCRLSIFSDIPDPLPSFILNPLYKNKFTLLFLRQRCQELRLYGNHCLGLVHLNED